ncbi:hypothetical protein CEV32_2579 [Brucella rhizosphaerae]|uniref:Uncharacterized protein n=1 Tax=Brucella rhizosphaerae TaxID=571254 RepID=A0A256F5L7_9HYPH|nr:hypothetical protein CEV32_2579 [Brucella rhizosphaerae]
MLATRNSAKGSYNSRASCFFPDAQKTLWLSEYVHRVFRKRITIFGAML